MMTQNTPCFHRIAWNVLWLHGDSEICSLACFIFSSFHFLLFFSLFGFLLGSEESVSLGLCQSGTRTDEKKKSRFQHLSFGFSFIIISMAPAWHGEVFQKGEGSKDTNQSSKIMFLMSCIHLVCLSITRDQLVTDLSMFA